jgi:hypothetical protein
MASIDTRSLSDDALETLRFRAVAMHEAGDTQVSIASALGVHQNGLELRINVPLFGAPLRFIWAHNLDPLENLPSFDQERFQSFDFSIGTSF